MTLLDPHQEQPQLHLQCECVPLDPAERELADQFYRRHGSRMKTTPAHQVWVVRSDRLHACLCLQQVAQGYWLTSLFVDPALRKKGLASWLVREACAPVTRPVWLFCHPDLEPVYSSLGFANSTLLPESLADKLQRYRRSKPLLAMCKNC